MIEINNLTTVQVDEEFLKKVAEKILEEERRKSDLSIVLVGPARMRKLNKKYRGKNRTTDVLAFPQSKAILKKFPFGELEKFGGLGEIVICLREVKKNAKRFGLVFEKELVKVFIHGLLHLLGYDHEISRLKAGEMEKKESHYLSEIFKS